MPQLRVFLPWLAIAALILVPLAFAATSPLLAWRDPVYIIAGLAGVAGMGLLLLQPLLAAGLLPGFAVLASRRIHRWLGALLVVCVVIHVAALWITSPPDVIDAMTFTSPTPFAVWGVIAMWAIFAAALIAALRKRLRLRPQLWRMAHTTLAILIVAGTILHALLIEGTMETVSKAILAAAIGAALIKAIAQLKVWRGALRR